MKVHIYEESLKRLKVAFMVKLASDPDADFDEFAERIVNRLVTEAPLTKLPLLGT